MSSPVNKILDQFISNIDFSQSVITAEFDGTSTNITVSDTFHLRNFMDITIDDIENVLVNNVIDNVINVTGDYSAATTIIIPKPFFFFGTPKQTNILLQEIQSKNKMPLIYLYQILQEKRIKTPNSSVDTEAIIQLFFLDNSSIEWSTELHYDNVIDRMRSLFYYIEDNIFKSTLFESDLIDDVTLIDHANFGKFIKDEGYDGSIFDENMSGVEMRIKLPISNYTQCIEILQPCLGNLIQRLDNTCQNVDGKWYSRDISGNGYDLELRSGCVEFNGIDNEIILNEDIVSNEPITLTIDLFKSRVSSNTLCLIEKDNYLIQVRLDEFNLTIIQREPSVIFRSSPVTFSEFDNITLTLNSTTGDINWEYGDDSGVANVAPEPIPTSVWNIKFGRLFSEAFGGQLFGCTISNSQNIFSNYNFAENSGATVYDTSGNGNDGTILGTLDDVRALSPYARPNNQLDGYSKNGDAFVPSGAAPITVQGKPKCFNGSETVGYQPDLQALKDVDAQFDTPLWYSGGSPIAVDLTALTFDYEGKALWFNNVSNPPYYKSWLVYSAPISGGCLSQTEKFIEKQ